MEIGGHSHQIAGICTCMILLCLHALRAARDKLPRVPPACGAVRQSECRRRALTPVAVVAKRMPPGMSDEVVIQRPAPNKRKVSCGIVVRRPPSVVWRVLTDYNRLADYIPNLGLSRRRYHPDNGIRVEQCGVQSILGFEFKASVIMDMTEVVRDKNNREIFFDMVESRDFQEFRGYWKLQSCDQGTATKLMYEVEIVPRGFVPVQMVEWRIREDIPVNLENLKLKSESLPVDEPQSLPNTQGRSLTSPQAEQREGQR